MALNPVFGFMGGTIEYVPEGHMTVADETTGQPREVVWSNHLRLTAGRKVLKLNKMAVKAIHDLYTKDPEFRKLVEECP